MRALYDVVLFLYNAFIGIASLFGNKKAQLWRHGRKGWEERLSDYLTKAGNKRVWVHCASLGEFEQGRPLIERIKSEDSSVFIVLSFFSPSGYEQKKSYPLADLVCYLPTDTHRNAEKFIGLVSPSYVIFVKYEFWFHYFEELKKRNIPLYVASAIFRPSQIFFGWYGAFYRGILRNVRHFFVQDNDSADLLSKYDFKNVTIAGDTRFDRVSKIVSECKKIPVVESFRGNSRLLVAGSTWPEDEELLISAYKSLNDSGLKMVIAPHEIEEKRMNDLMLKLKSYFGDPAPVRFSSSDNSPNAKILVVDNIGLLSSIYGYGSIAWIGGGFGKGIHNILEASAFGIPVIFGPNYLRFREAVDLITLGGAFSVNNTGSAIKILNELLNDQKKLSESAKASSEYVVSQIGATGKIYDAISKMNL